MSGEAAQFTEKEKFDSIVRFLSARWAVLNLSQIFISFQSAHEDGELCGRHKKPGGKTAESKILP